MKLFFPFLCFLLVNFNAVVNGENKILVDETDLLQVIHGCGGSWTDSSAWLYGGPRNSPNDREELTSDEKAFILNALFDPDEGIGLNILRQPMGTSDFRWSDYTYHDDQGVGFTIDRDLPYIVPTIIDTFAVNSHITVMSLPWSPPAWMKENNNLNGGSMKNLQESYDALGAYFADYVQAYKDAGVSIWAVSVQNEPQHEVGDYPTMRMSTIEHARAIKSIKQALVDRGFGEVKIVIYDHNWDDPNYPLAVLSDSDAKAASDAVAFHCYAGDVSAQSTVKASLAESQEIFFTECTETGAVTSFNGDFRWALRNLVIGATNNWASTVFEWNLLLDGSGGPKISGGCSNCRGLLDVTDWSTVPKTIEKRPAYYALGHLSKFLVDGARRIGSAQNFSDGVTHSVAFLNTGGSAFLIILNDASPSKSYTIKWFGFECVVEVPAWSAVTVYSADPQDRSTAQIWATYDGDPSTRLARLSQDASCSPTTEQTTAQPTVSPVTANPQATESPAEPTNPVTTQPTLATTSKPTITATEPPASQSPDPEPPESCNIFYNILQTLFGWLLQIIFGFSFCDL